MLHLLNGMALRITVVPLPLVRSLIKMLTLQLIGHFLLEHALRSATNVITSALLYELMIVALLFMVVSLISVVLLREQLV